LDYVVYACGLLAVVLVVALLGVVVVGWLRRDRTRGQPPAVCLYCQGRGWIDRTERTFNFTADGFENVTRPAAMCEVCHGSGRLR
jgi:hypothetical protein